jgi:integrase
LLAAETALRISEVIGLTYGRVDLDEETMEVAAQMAKDGSIRPHTKSRRSRVVPLSAKAAATLRAHKARMAEEGYRTDDEALIFVTKTGRPQSRRNCLRAWQNALERIGVEGAGLHSLRHSFASRLAERDVPVVLASELVGHARVQTTQDVYTRVRGSRDERVETLRSALASPPSCLATPGNTPGNNGSQTASAHAVQACRNGLNFACNSPA